MSLVRTSDISSAVLAYALEQVVRNSSNQKSMEKAFKVASIHILARFGEVEMDRDLLILMGSAVGEVLMGNRSARGVLEESAVNLTYSKLGRQLTRGLGEDAFWV